MKTPKIFLALTLGLGLFLVSCECRVCTQEGENDVRICRDNYDSQSDYEDAVAFYQIGGYSCNP